MNNLPMEFRIRAQWAILQEMEIKLNEMKIKLLKECKKEGLKMEGVYETL